METHLTMTTTSTTAPAAAAVGGPFASRARVVTASGSRYLQQLCKHFAHKLPTTFDPTIGRIDFPLGPVDLAADADGLDLSLAAPSEADRATLEDVVVRHLVRFAFRETLEVAWTHGEAVA
jgi:uncharacterized protein